jgi:DNA-directed RNA polymerase subunit K/omega
MGAPFLIELKPGDLEKMKFNPVEIAKMEYDAGKIPIGVKRVMPYERA